MYYINARKSFVVSMFGDVGRPVVVVHRQLVEESDSQDDDDDEAKQESYSSDCQVQTRTIWNPYFISLQIL